MPDIAQLVPKKTASATPQRLPVRAIITTPPASLDALTTRVVIPSYTTDYDQECRWIRQGNTLPTAGADCFVAFDENGAGIVIWWTGGGQITAAGPAGGDLAGTYPNPTLAPPPQARVFNSTSQTLTTATVTLLTFDSERFDNGAVHSTTSNTGRLTAQTAGTYLVGAKLNWQVAGTGRRDAIILHSSGAEVAHVSHDATSTGVAFQSPSGPWQAAAGEYFTVSGYHERGSNLTVDAEFWMTWLSH